MLLTFKEDFTGHLVEERFGHINSIISPRHVTSRRFKIAIKANSHELPQWNLKTSWYGKIIGINEA